MNNGGPAFPYADREPCPNCHAVNKPSKGMSLRDWFAGQVAHELVAVFGEVIIDDSVYVKEVARRAYEVADAMILERERNQ